ncbi:sec-independent translocase [Nocardioides daejeonensis]|uniref:sec-independent translocase n=1 Tax=Nocardioides daejeonensis TaxID=1046556 RepID=UPI000D74C10C|nr:sec-independent translocase [Nocardioides daejeonensis]
MFGIGLPELAVIAFVAVVVFGPDRLPELAKQAAGIIKQLRAFSNTARDNLREELGPEFADLELRDLDPRELVRKHLLEAMDDEEKENAGETPAAPVSRPLAEGELPPYDPEAT